MYATLRRSTDNLSRRERTSSEKGSRLVRLSSSPFSRSRCRFEGLVFVFSGRGLLVDKEGKIWVVTHRNTTFHSVSDSLPYVISGKRYSLQKLLFDESMVWVHIPYFRILRNEEGTPAKFHSDKRTNQQKKSSQCTYGNKTDAGFCHSQPAFGADGNDATQRQDL